MRHNGIRMIVPAYTLKPRRGHESCDRLQTLSRASSPVGLPSGTATAWSRGARTSPKSVCEPMSNWLPVGVPTRIEAVRPSLSLEALGMSSASNDSNCATLVELKPRESACNTCATPSSPAFMRASRQVPEMSPSGPSNVNNSSCPGGMPLSVHWASGAPPTRSTCDASSCRQKHRTCSKSPLAASWKTSKRPRRTFQEANVLNVPSNAGSVRTSRSHNCASCAASSRMSTESMRTRASRQLDVLFR
mmetsp:Transcript_61081/g.177016  ORF Transcript_61081/g.177016 Transcript_61081/m.177016 type:complete len:247 (-) Transcript_61081:530-1270(-)